MQNIPMKKITRRMMNLMRKIITVLRKKADDTAERKLYPAEQNAVIITHHHLDDAGVSTRKRTLHKMWGPCFSIQDIQYGVYPLNFFSSRVVSARDRVLVILLCLILEGSMLASKFLLCYYKKKALLYFSQSKFSSFTFRKLYSLELSYARFQKFHCAYNV